MFQEVVQALLSEQERMGFDELGQRNPLSWAMEQTFLIKTCFSQIMFDSQIA